ncbi:hypothetical protein HHI36_009486 [Cryptolaemus montrouzieri]|uniref:SUN domain-containing protein n=1 Tax=Cryptolaemus montrouzieri TaxID=559131 RepID=A0ABD2MFU2_9CUCU
MVDNEKKSKEPKEFIPVEENLTHELKRGPNIQNSCYLIRHFFKCVVLAVICFILLEKISRQYNILHVETNYEETSLEPTVMQLEQKENLTFFCDQKLEIDNDNVEALNLLRTDILNLKQLVIKLGEQVRERRRFECIAKKELSKIEDRVKKVLTESDTVDRKIERALHTYEADKVALFDYAASYAGGEVVAILDATPATTNKISKLLGFFKLAKESSPGQIVNPSCLPGECFTFLGSTAKIIIKLGKSINIGSVSLEHSFLVEDVSSAPKDFQVYALKDPSETSKTLIGKFTYEIKNSRSLQTFEIPSGITSSNKYEYVLLEILNNHGHKEHSSVYRFRVHSR